MSGIIVGMALVVAICAALAAISWFRGRIGRTFAAEFDRLVRTTPIEWHALRGPGRTPQTVLGRDAANLRPKPLSVSDWVYYTSCWQQVKGEFAESPAGSLHMAEHLTANLLLTRGLVPAGTLRPAVLPAEWSFRTAQGYRVAQRISSRTNARASRLAGAQTVPPAALANALSLFEAFFREMLTISATESSQSSDT
jgi:hypothetical protein